MRHKQLGISLAIPGGKWYTPVLPDIHPWNSQDPLMIWSRMTFCSKRRVILYRAQNYTNVISIDCIWPLRILRESLFANPFILTQEVLGYGLLSAAVFLFLSSTARVPLWVLFQIDSGQPYMDPSLLPLNIMCSAPWIQEDCPWALLGLWHCQ